MDIDKRTMASGKTVYKEKSLDRGFRKVMHEVIDRTQKELLVATGEAGAFENYQDLRWAIERAIKRGVKVKVYAFGPDQKTINKMISLGCEVYLGDEVPKDHFTVADAKEYVVSYEHTPHKIGVRKGAAEIDSVKAREKKKEFSRYIKKAKKARFDAGSDPILKILKKPLNLSFETDSKNVEL